MSTARWPSTPQCPVCRAALIEGGETRLHQSDGYTLRARLWRCPDHPETRAELPEQRDTPCT